MFYMSLALRIVLSLIFVAAGGAKLFGVAMMVETFESIGWGQWFRYVTALVEIGATALLWVPGTQVIGAGLLFTTMICGALFHFFVIGPSAFPAIVLAALCGVFIALNRDQLRIIVSRLTTSN